MARLAKINGISLPLGIRGPPTTALLIPVGTIEIIMICRSVSEGTVYGSILLMGSEA